MNFFIVLLILPLGLLLGATTRPTTTAPTEASAVKEAYGALMDAAIAGDAAGMRARLAYHGPVETSIAEALIEFDQALAHLREVSHKAFEGKDLRPLLGTSPQEIRQQISSATVEMHGSEALIQVGGLKVKMVRVNGQWKQSISQIVDGWPASKARRLAAELKHQAALYNDLAAEVADQKFHSPRQAAEKLREWLLKPTSRPSTRP